MSAKTAISFPIFGLLISGITSVYTHALQSRPDAPASVIATIPGLAGITTDDAGYFYLPSWQKNTITVLDGTGSIKKSIGPSIGNGQTLQFSQLRRAPIHVDKANNIYVLSGNYLTILSPDGKILNVDPQGKRLRGFEIGDVHFIGTSTNGAICVSPSPDDESALFCIISADGSHVGQCGNRLFKSSSPLKTYFHIVMRQNNNLYAFPSNYAAFFIYSGGCQFIGYRQVRCPDFVEEQISTQNLSLEKALVADKEGRIPEGQIPIKSPVFLDAKALDPDTLVCLTNGGFLAWYNADTGMLLKTYSVWKSAGIFPNAFAMGQDAKYVVALELNRSSQVFKINLP